jgi:hypothetical protein
MRRRRPLCDHAPRLCTHCPQPHVTNDWYQIDESKHPCRGDVECAKAHERRIVREVRDGVPAAWLIGSSGSPLFVTRAKPGKPRGKNTAAGTRSPRPAFSAIRAKRSRRF